MVTQAEKDELLARIEKAQSVGATILSNMTAAKKQVEAWPVGTVGAVYVPGSGGVLHD